MWLICGPITSSGDGTLDSAMSHVTVTSHKGDYRANPTMVLPAVYNPASQLYLALWNTTRVPDASYNLRAFAVDAQGNRGESRSILVKVDNVPYLS
jgi:hypothetical protein